MTKATTLHKKWLKSDPAYRSAYKALAPEYKKRSKYRNTVVGEDGEPYDPEIHKERFDSKAEWKRWKELQLLERAGEVRVLRRQVRYPLVVNGVHLGDYVSDFDYYEPYNKPAMLSPMWAPIVEDSKGVQTPEFKIKRKLMKACHGIDIRITGKSK